MKNKLCVFLITSFLVLLSSCAPAYDNSMFSARLATVQASPLKEYTFIIDGHEKKICGNFTYEDWSPFGSTYYVGWSDGSLIGYFPVPPTTAFPKPDCKNF